MADYQTDFSGYGDFVLLSTSDSNWVDVDGDYYTFEEGAYGNSADNATAYNGITFADNQYSEIVVDIVAAFAYTGVAVRIKTDNTANFNYFYGSGSGGSIAGSCVNGTYTDEAATGGNISATDVLRLEIDGTDLTPFINGSEVTAITPWSNSDHASGNAGLAHQGASSGSRAGSVDVGDLGGGPTISIPVIMNQLRNQGIN